MSQKKYWNQMWTLKYEIEFYKICLKDSQNIQRVITITLKVTSSSSIAGWLIWKDFGFLWAFILGISQVLEAIKNYLPYEKRIKPLKKLISNQESLLIKIENLWYKVSNGKVEDEEIHNLYIRLKAKIKTMEDNCLMNVEIPEYKWVVSKAKKSTEAYFKNFLT